MNNRYMRELRRQMRCSRKTQNRLLEQFTAYQLKSLDETPDYEQMVTMFGSPDEMAQTLMEEVSQEEQSIYQRKKQCLKGAGIAACILWAVFTFYIFVIKSIPIQLIEKTYCNSEIVETTSPEG